VDCQPVVDGKARVAAGQVGDPAVLLQLRCQRRERVREVLQEREHLRWRKLVLHHYETHEVQTSSVLVLNSPGDEPLTPEFDTQQIGNALDWGAV